MIWLLWWLCFLCNNGTFVWLDILKMEIPLWSWNFNLNINIKKKKKKITKNITKEYYFMRNVPMLTFLRFASGSVDCSLGQAFTYNTITSRPLILRLPCSLNTFSASSFLLYFMYALLKRKRNHQCNFCYTEIWQASLQTFLSCY